ncbi:MAG: hypothetical protein SVN78_05375 [Deferribacterota bacterium]|nr:hypothetical protein [Deferribacterota bacterium]
MIVKINNNIYNRAYIVFDYCDIIAELYSKKHIITNDLDLSVLNTIREELPLINDYKFYEK